LQCNVGARNNRLTERRRNSEKKVHFFFFWRLIFGAILALDQGKIEVVVHHKNFTRHYYFQEKTVFPKKQSFLQYYQLLAKSGVLAQHDKKKSYPIGIFLNYQEVQFQSLRQRVRSGFGPCPK
jgi:hypothetical protein